MADRRLPRAARWPKFIVALVALSDRRYRSRPKRVDADAAAPAGSLPRQPEAVVASAAAGDAA